MRTWGFSERASVTERCRCRFFERPSLSRLIVFVIFFPVVMILVVRVVLMVRLSRLGEVLGVVSSRPSLTAFEKSSGCRLMTSMR